MRKWHSPLASGDAWLPLARFLLLPGVARRLESRNLIGRRGLPRKSILLPGEPTTPPSALAIADFFKQSTDKNGIK